MAYLVKYLLHAREKDQTASNDLGLESHYLCLHVRQIHPDQSRINLELPRASPRYRGGAIDEGYRWSGHRERLVIRSVKWFKDKKPKIECAYI